MRLIDADALIKKMPTEMDMQELYLPIHFKEMLIDETPTVDAIPVDWIEDQIRQIVENSEYNASNIYAAGAIEAIVDDWREKDD